VRSQRWSAFKGWSGPRVGPVPTSPYNLGRVKTRRRSIAIEQVSRSKPSSRERGHGGYCCAVSTKSDRMTSTSVQLSSATPTGEGADAAA
jgi:hypothetical protein